MNIKTEALNHHLTRPISENKRPEAGQVDEVEVPAQPVQVPADTGDKIAQTEQQSSYQRRNKNG